MWSAYFEREKRLVHVVVTAGVIMLAGCAPSQPIVANPLEPWEGELARERQAAEASVAPKSSVARHMYGADEDEGHEAKNSPVVVAIADIIAFPFRGAGWLAQQIF